MKVSVIIPCKNEEDTVPYLLSSLCKQTFKYFEVVAIDDGSSDGTAQRLHSFSEMFPINTIVHKKSKGIARSRNAGVKAAKGDYILMLDADNELNDTFLEGLYNIATQRGTPAAPYYLFTRDTWVENLLVKQLRFPLGWDDVGEGLAPIFFKREEAPTWDPEIDFGDDRLLYDYPFTSTKKSVCTVHMPHTLKELFHQQEFYGRGWWRLFRRDWRMALPMLWRLLFFFPPATAVIILKRFIDNGVDPRFIFIDALKSVAFTYGMLTYMVRGEHKRR